MSSHAYSHCSIGDALLFNISTSQAHITRKCAIHGYSSVNSGVQLDGSRRCEGRSRRPPSAIHGSVSFGVLQVSFRVIQNASIVQQFVFEFEFKFAFKPLHSNGQ